jgi:hypothetical protein
MVKAKPDIYYVIFDRYGDDQTARTYGLENDIGDYLTSQGLLRCACEHRKLHEDCALAVFNTYFGTNLPLLPDRTLRHVSDLQPFVFDDITTQMAMARSDAKPH